MSLSGAGKIGNDEFLLHPKTVLQYLHISLTAVPTVRIDYSTV
jgi:hypothetical protein